MLRKKWAKGLLSFLAACQIFTMTAYAKPDWPSDTGIMAEAGALMDMDSGTLILGQNCHVEYPPASITKILTALLVIENADLSDVVTYSETAMNSVEADSGNKLSLVAGDQMTVEDCLYALLLQSVNQSANALAEHVAGSIPAFVDMMNERAAQMGLTECHFENPSGLNGDSHYVSAYDMAKIAQEAYSNETMLAISSAISHKLGATSNNPDGVTVSNEHRLVITEDSESPYYCPEAKAGKTGYLLKAGNTLVTYAEKDGKRLISVILKGSPGQYFVDGKTLLDFGFARFQNMDIAANETRYVTGEESVDIGGTAYAPADLMVEPGRVITLPNEAVFSDAELSLAELPENYPKGSVAVLRYIYNEREIGSAYLVKKAEYTGEMLYQETPAAGQEEETQETQDGQDGQEAQGSQDGQEESAGSKESEETGSLPEDGSSADGDTAPANSPDAKAGRGIGAAAVIGAVAAALAAALGVFLMYRKKKEQEEAALRRERRRKRLMEEGAGAEEEFNRLLEEKRNRSREGRRR